MKEKRESVIEIADDGFKRIALDGYSTNGISTLIDISNTAFANGYSDVGLKITQGTKNLISNHIKQELGMTVREIDAKCLENGTDFDELSLFWECVLNETPYLFESFIEYMEKNRPCEKKFYAPRRKTLHAVVNDLQKLENSTTQKFYGLSMPSRVGKSSTGLLFLAWIAMKKPNSHNAMGGHSGTLVKGFYKELYNFITSSEYTFGEIYAHTHPHKTFIRDKSAEDYTITLGSPDRFATLTCRGIDATWTGAVDVSKDGFLYVDDLVRDRQHSLSPSRMEETYQEYQNTMLDRLNDGAKIVMVGTLWNVLDPLERERHKFIDDDRYVFRRIPALNEKDESNFAYEHNGFSTQYYIEMRDRLDKAEWMAKFQQQPFVREGLLFPEEELQFFNGIIPEEIRCVTANCDPAFGGGDSLSMPIKAETRDGKRYIIDWIHNKGTQKITIPRIASKILLHHVVELNIEANNGGKLLAENIKKELADRNINFCKIKMTYAPTGVDKQHKINGYSDYVKANYIFIQPKKYDVLDSSVPHYTRDSEYQSAMDELEMYTSEGKNFHDDAPDVMVQMAISDEKRSNGTIKAVKNPFWS